MNSREDGCSPFSIFHALNSLFPASFCDSFLFFFFFSTLVPLFYITLVFPINQSYLYLYISFDSAKWFTRWTYGHEGQRIGRTVTNILNIRGPSFGLIVFLQLGHLGYLGSGVSGEEIWVQMQYAVRAATPMRTTEAGLPLSLGDPSRALKYRVN